jgi:hypothetical protein
MSQTPSPAPRLVLNWDLSRSHRIADLDWPADLASNHRFWQGDIQLTAKLPGDRVLKAELADLRAERQGDELYVLELRGHPQSLEQALAEVEQRMKQFDLPRRDLDQWAADIRSGDFRKDRPFASRRNDLTPAVSLELRHAYHPERPWYLSWEIAWPTLSH